MGEPLANYANVIQAIRVMHDPGCFNIGARKITLSTVGVPAKMRELANENLPLNLAISLHAPNEELRKQLIPWAEHFALDDILDAARYYFDQTGREVTLEYILLAGVNDQVPHAKELAKLCKTLRANVNLIRYNAVEGLPFARPKSDDVLRFQDVSKRPALMPTCAKAAAATSTPPADSSVEKARRATRNRGPGGSKFARGWIACPSDV